MITHTGDTLYGCLHCHKTGNSDYNMNVHCKNAHPQEWAEEQRNKIELKDNPQAIDFDMSTDTSVSSIEQKDNIMKPSVILSKVPKTTKTRKRKTQKLKDINNPNKSKYKISISLKKLKSINPNLYQFVINQKKQSTDQEKSSKYCDSIQHLI